MPRTLFALLLGAALGCASSGTPLQPGEWVRGPSNLYEIQATGFRWQRMARGSAPDDAELALRESADKVLFVHVYDGSEHSVDELLASRRRGVRSLLPIASQEEQREFLGGADLVPVAWLQIRIGSPGSGTAFYSMAFVDTGAKIIEVVAINNGSRKGELGNAQLRRVVRSIRLLPGSNPT
jgi:hypothetical protein